MSRIAGLVYPVIIAASSALVLVSCGGGQHYEYWKGSIADSYYVLDLYGDRQLQVTGIPFMCVKYDPTDHSILDVEFGLSGVTQQYLETENGIHFPEPTLDAGNVSYASRLGLKSPVALLLNWPVAASSGQVNNGVQMFTVTTDNSTFNFVYNSVEMDGEVTNTDEEYFEGRESEVRAFHLMKE
ncbi:MAG TPA: hypothetical protein VMH22_08715 [bacterium]|nr:hypothetical protein [bacterium]